MNIFNATRTQPFITTAQPVRVGEHKQGDDNKNLRYHQPGASKPEESKVDLEGNYGCLNLVPLESSPFQLFPSGGQHPEAGSTYFSWPTLSRLNNAPMLRETYFSNLQKGVLPEIHGGLPSGKQATTLLELLTIRAFHSENLCRFSHGTAVGYRIRKGSLTNIPAILAFVGHKVHRQWLSGVRCLPKALEGPGGIWCELDVVEFSYSDPSSPSVKQQLYNELIESLTGGDPFIGSGSQVASQKSLGTIGPIVKSRTENKQLGFLTSRHIAVDLEYPNQKMFHPLPPSHGPGVYLGSVGRATTFVTDDLWYGIFAAANPETFVRADGAFVPFAENFPINDVKTSVKGVGQIGKAQRIDLQAPIKSLIGRQVMKVGRSSGLSTGIIMAYALEYNDGNGVCFVSDLMVVGENQKTFDLEGDSGSLILLNEQNGEQPRPLALICCGTGNRGHIKLHADQSPVAWTSAVDLGRLLDLLELDIITNDEDLQAAAKEQKHSPTYVSSREKRGERFHLFDMNVHSATDMPLQEPTTNSNGADPQNQEEKGAYPLVEHPISPRLIGTSASPSDEIQVDLENQSLSAAKNGTNEVKFVEPEAKKMRQTDHSVSEESN